MPNDDALLPIQEAMKAAADGDATLAGKVTAVVDHVAEATGYPYIQIGEAIDTPQGAHDRFGARTAVTWHIWSTFHGFEEALDIRGDLLRVFDHQPLTVAGHHTVVVRHEQTVTIRDPDPDIRHVAVRFAVETEHAA